MPPRISIILLQPRSNNLKTSSPNAIENIFTRNRRLLNRHPKVGRMRVDLSLDNLDPDFLNHSKSENNYVEEDGFFRPATCLPQHKVAIVIPYRDREQHLHILLKHLHGVLQRQLLFYKVFVIEQVSSKNKFSDI